MAFYEQQAGWSPASRQAPWERTTSSSSRSAAADAASSTTAATQEPDAFASQLEEIERAMDNLMKSGKMFGLPGRREPFAAQAHPRLAGSRHQSVTDYDALRSRSSSSSVQGYYQNQRFQPRQSEADQMMQAKRRMAAQRERELRNYHQEQQYNRSVLADMSASKSDRSMSPNAMTEDERRDLIARQNRALYGNEASFYAQGEAAPPRPISQDARVNVAMRGASPLAYDQTAPGKDQQAAPGQPRSRANSTSSPSSNPNANNFTLFENAQQSSRTSDSSPGDSPHPAGTTSGGVAPIGTRPSQQSATSNPTSKRSTTPQPPSLLGFGANLPPTTTTATSSSNPPSAVPDKGMGFSSYSGGWGVSKNSLGAQASVWG